MYLLVKLNCLHPAIEKVLKLVEASRIHLLKDRRESALMPVKFKLY